LHVADYRDAVVKADFDFAGIQGVVGEVDVSIDPFLLGKYKTPWPMDRKSSAISRLSASVSACSSARSNSFCRALMVSSMELPSLSRRDVRDGDRGPDNR
jgi:hypothetical protein